MKILTTLFISFLLLASNLTFGEHATKKTAAGKSRPADKAAEHVATSLPGGTLISPKKQVTIPALTNIEIIDGKSYQYEKVSDNDDKDISLVNKTKKKYIGKQPPEKTKIGECSASRLFNELDEVVFKKDPKKEPYEKDGTTIREYPGFHSDKPATISQDVLGANIPHCVNIPLDDKVFYNLSCCLADEKKVITLPLLKQILGDEWEIETQKKDK